MRRPRPERGAILWTALLTMSCGPHARGDDWPQWGGPQRDLIWREPGIVERLPAGKLPRVWSAPLGEGYTGPAVANGRVFVTDRVHGEGRSGRDRVLCLDAGTGDVLWQHEYACEYLIQYPAGPRATPVCDEGRVYTIDGVGNMFCFDAESGDVVWSKDFTRDFGTRLPTWGMAASPLVDGDQLITLVGGSGALIVSFDKRTGEERWRALEDRGVGYCPPMIFEFGDRRQLIVYHPRAVSGLDPADGRRLWSVPFDVQSGLTIATPRVVGTRLLVTAFYNGSLMLDVNPDASGADIVWQGHSDSETNTDGLHGLMCTPVFTGTHVYGVCSYGQLRCLDAATGERLWETRAATGDDRWWNAFLVPYLPVPHAARVRPDGSVPDAASVRDAALRTFIHNEQGDLIIADLSPEGYNEHSRALLVEPTRPVRRRMTIWSHPAFAMRSVFARNDREIVRVSLAAE